MQVIILVRVSGLQVFYDGESLAVKGCTRDIPNEDESWKRIFDNLNVDPATLHLKIIWDHVDYEVLRHCGAVFPNLASLEIEMFKSFKKRLDAEEINDENFKACFNVANVVEDLKKEKNFIGNKLKKLQAVLRDRRE